MTNGNIRTNVGLYQMLNAHFLETTSPPTKHRIGDNTTTPTTADTDLGRKIPVDNTETVDDCEAITGWSAGTDSAVTLNSTTYKEGSGSLSLAKSGTTGTSMSMDKTTTSRDFTSKDFWVWVYITDTTDFVASGTALTIRFGSDNSNYYYYNVDITDLSNGWNLITFNTTTASGTSGSPTITACDYTYFAFNTDLSTDTIAADQVLIDEIIVASSTDYDISLLSGYPKVDTTLLQAETRSQLTTTIANGKGFTESGELDASNNLQSHNVFDLESKSATDIFYNVEIVKIRNQG